MSRQRPYRTWLLVIALVMASAWLLGSPQVAEALNEWTVRLAEMTLAQYPPGYGTPDLY